MLSIWQLHKLTRTRTSPAPAVGAGRTQSHISGWAGSYGRSSGSPASAPRTYPTTPLHPQWPEDADWICHCLRRIEKQLPKFSSVVNFLFILFTSSYSFTVRLLHMLTGVLGFSMSGPIAGLGYLFVISKIAVYDKYIIKTIDISQSTIVLIP